MGKKSNFKHVQYGVPQGCVLGLLLFLLYTNDLVAAVGENKLRLFADYSNVFVTADNATTLQQKIKEVLSSIFIWFKANKLTANINKTAYSIWKRHGEIPGCLNSIRIDNRMTTQIHLAKNKVWFRFSSDLYQFLSNLCSKFTTSSATKNPEYSESPWWS